MLLKDLLYGTELLRCTADLNQNITGVSYDSRTVRPGDLFVAVPGFSSDGHRFISAARQRGASAILCQTSPEDGPFIQVASTRQVLAELACRWFGHPARELVLIGITGTNGKTTSCFLLKSVIEQITGEKVGLIGTIQNMIGQQVLPAERTTPESWQLQELFRSMADAGCKYVVMEVSSHALALNRVDGFTFHTGVFTNLTQDHLDFHKTMQAYLETKALLFSRCEIGVVNRDDSSCDYLLHAAHCPVLTYGEQPADLTAGDIILGQDHISMQVSWHGQTLPARLGIPGDFNVHNALAVICAALTLDLPLDRILDALSRAKGVRGRVEVVPTPGRNYTVLIDYAHTPDGLENVLKTVRGFAKGRTVVLFGCGGDRDRTKRPIMGEIASRLAHEVIVTSDNPRTEDPIAIIHEILPGLVRHTTPYTIIPDRRRAIAWALDHARAGDVIVLAGKGHETYQILGATKIHLDEREVVQNHLCAADANKRRNRS